MKECAGRVAAYVPGSSCLARCVACGEVMELRDDEPALHVGVEQYDVLYAMPAHDDPRRADATAVRGRRRDRSSRPPQ